MCVSYCCLCVVLLPVDELERLEKAFDVVKKQLFGRLHAIARKSLLPDPAQHAPAAEADAAPRSNGTTKAASSRSSSSSESEDNSHSSTSSRGGSSTSSSVASLPSLSGSTPAAATPAAAAAGLNGKMHNGAEKAVPASTASENGVVSEPSGKKK